MHVALNLVYLVPGEVGGMEVYARELVPRLAARDDLRITCLVNREAAEAGDGPWGEVCPMEVVPVRARNRIEWVRGEQQYVPRIATRVGADVIHSLASTAPLRGQAGARDDDPRPQLPARCPRRTSACVRSGCACSCRRRPAARGA